MAAPVGTGRLLSSALDPVLVPAGFQPGQHGDGAGGDIQVIFCIAHDELSRRHPHLPQAHRQQPTGTCDDLVVDVRADGMLARLDLEGFSLDETLRHVGLVADARAVARAMDRPVVDHLAELTCALGRLVGEVA